MRVYKVFYILGLAFMGLFFLSTLSSGTPLYILFSLICFLISAKYYPEE